MFHGSYDTDAMDVCKSRRFDKIDTVDVSSPRELREPKAGASENRTDIFRCTDPRGPNKIHVEVPFSRSRDLVFCGRGTTC